MEISGLSQSNALVLGIQLRYSGSCCPEETAHTATETKKQPPLPACCLPLLKVTLQDSPNRVIYKRKFLISLFETPEISINEKYTGSFVLSASVAARSEVEDGTCGRYIGFNLMRMARHAGLLDLRTFTRRDAAKDAVLGERPIP